MRFAELNDPVDQRRRFEMQLTEKASAATMKRIRWTRTMFGRWGMGLPPTAGEGIGIDRLTMILTGSEVDSGCDSVSVDAAGTGARGDRRPGGVSCWKV